MKKILCLLLENVFATKIDFESPPRLRITNHKMLSMYFSTMFSASKFNEMKEFVIENFAFMKKIIEESYYNDAICGKVFFIFIHSLNCLRK